MGLRLAVAGATGLVGRRLLNIVAASGEDIEEIGAFASADSAGRIVRSGYSELTVCSLTDCDFSGYDAALFCIGDELSAEYVPKALEAGCAVVDKSNAFRMQPGVPLVVAGVNDGAIVADSTLVANPNCSTIILLHALFPLEREFGIRRVWAATYQSVSGAGSAAVERLEDQIELAPAATELVEGLQIDAGSLAYNVIPSIGRLDGQQRCSEEAKLVEESRKIMARPDLPVIAHAARVPVVVGHSIAVTVELEHAADQGSVVAAWAQSPDVTFLPEALPSPLTSQRHDKVEIGRLRRESGVENGFSFFISGDNVNLGAALNGWRILMLMRAAGAVREQARAANL